MKEWSTLKKLIWLRKINGGGGGDPLNTFTGAIVRFLAKKAKPIVKLEANFTPVQDLNGYDAPWPPGGGKNLLDPSKRTEGSANIYYYSSDGILLKGGQAYTLSVSESASGLYIKPYPSGANLATAYGKTALTYTPPNDVQVFFDIYYASAPSGGISAVICQLELGSSATSYAPYSNICPISGHDGCDIFDKAEYDAQATPTVTISFGQTVYGGTLTVNEDGTGTVTATDTGSPQLLWARGSANNAGTGRIFYAYYTRAETNVSTITMTNGALKTVTRPSAWEAQEENSISFGATNVIIVTDNVDTTLADLPTWLSNKGLQLVGTLKTPLTFTVTASQINTLAGTNTVWVDSATGDITVQAYGTAIT